MLIRPATTRDARAIGRVQSRDWQIGYRDYVPADYLARFTPERLSASWLAGLAELQPHETLVAEDADEMVAGCTAFGRNRSDLGPGVAEVSGLYVDPDYWDRGIGTALLEAAEQALARAGYGSAVLWTLEASERTRRFYEDRGWRFDGAAETHRSGARVVRYGHALPPAVDPDPGSA